MPRNYDSSEWIPVARFMSERLHSDEAAGSAVGCDPSVLWQNAKFNTLIRWLAAAEKPNNAKIAIAIAMAAVDVARCRSDKVATLLGEAGEYLVGRRPAKLRGRIEAERLRLVGDAVTTLRMTAYAAEQVRLLGDYGPDSIDFAHYANIAASALVDLVSPEYTDRVRKDFKPPWER